MWNFIIPDGEAVASVGMGGALLPDFIVQQGVWLIRIQLLMLELAGMV